MEETVARVHVDCPICKLLSCGRAPRLVRRPRRGSALGVSLYPPPPHRPQKREEGDRAFHEKWYWEFLENLIKYQPDALPCCKGFDNYKHFHQADFDKWYEEIKYLSGQSKASPRKGCEHQ